jgi:hypothetical protein
MLNRTKIKFFIQRHLPALAWAGFLLIAILALAIIKTAPQVKTTALNQEELVKLVKPSVVRIIQHATGEAVLPNIITNLTTQRTELSPSSPYIKKEVDDYISGSGFIISPNGYIITNAHVASVESIKNSFIEQILKEKLYDPIDSLSEEELKKYFDSEADLAEYAQDLISLVEEESSFSLKSELMVLNPTASQESLEGLVQSSFKATRINVNDEFLQDEKDIALLKIDARNLPAAALGNSDGVSTGNKIYIFGFPVTAEFNRRNPLEATFTQGIVSALKFSENKSFKIFQTDAKISQGSSGGPLFNEKGEIIGIITFQTGEYQRVAGDNFAFAIPLNLVRAVLEKEKVTPQEGNYVTHFKKGLSLFHNNNCKQATEEFRLAEQSDNNFGTDKYINPYLQQCEDLIAEGGSVDSWFAKTFSSIKSINTFTWFVVLGRVTLVILAALMLVAILKRLRRDENELEELSYKLEEEMNGHNNRPNYSKGKMLNLPLPEGELHAGSRLTLSIPHPHVLNYIYEAREVGLSDSQIKQELGRVGWDAQEINQAFMAAE